MVQASNPCTEKLVKYQIMVHGICLTLKMIIIIIVVVVMTFMQRIYNYIPETNNVSRIYNVAAVLYLQFVLYLM